MGQMKELPRLQCLFEHCCLHAMENAANKGEKIDFTKDEAGHYVSTNTLDLFSLWIAGRNQGIADQAYYDDIIKF